MDYQILVVCVVLVLGASSVNARWWDSVGREWSESVPSDCPSEDSSIHVCRSLFATNTTCITFKCCGPSDYDSQEYEYSTEDYNDEEYEAARAEYEAETSCDVLCISIYGCTVYKCYDRCCDGYQPDEYGRCTNQTGTIACENGGTRVGDTCTCPYGFQGQSCEIPVCTNCMNGGECIVKDGWPYCNCTSDYYGKMCEFAKCSLECQNGGKCYKEGHYEVCRCPTQYIGKYCEHFFTNPEQCPAPEHSQSDYCESMMECISNDDCSDDHVCCHTGCGTVCKTPTLNYCQYEERYFKIGETFKRDACTTCTCTQDGLRCYSMACKARACPDGRQPEQRNVECCPSCTDKPMIPSIHNCPNTTVTVDITEGSNYADLKSCRLGIYALSGNGDELEVQFQPKQLRHPMSTTNRRPTWVTAYAVDNFQTTVSCSFDATVRDIYKPVFHSCPADIYVFEGEPAIWVEPRFTDNVGVLRLDKWGRGENGDVLPEGKYKITYSIEDFDHNKAECSFHITVTAKDTEFANMPQGLQRRSKDNSAIKLTIILAPIIGGLIIIGLILTLLLCYKRKMQRTSETTSTRTTSPAGYDNNIYSVPYDVADEVKGSVKGSVKLPEYSEIPLPLNPPAYSKTGSFKGSTYEAESPPSYHNPDYDSLH